MYVYSGHVMTSDDELFNVILTNFTFGEKFTNFNEFYSEYERTEQE